MKTSLIAGLSLGALLLAGCKDPQPIEIPVERIAFENQQYNLFVGDQKSISVLCYPENATNLDQLEVSNSNPNVATFENGLLTAKSSGRTSLRASCGSVSATASVQVYSGWFTKESKKYGVDKASGYYYMFGNTSPQEMEIELSYFGQDEEQHFKAWIKCSNLGKTIDFLQDMDESQVSVWKNQNEDGYSVPYFSSDQGRPVVVTADWSYTEATLTKGLLTITDLSGGKYKLEADFALSNGYTFTANWEGQPYMQKEG